MVDGWLGVALWAGIVEKDLYLPSLIPHPHNVALCNVYLIQFSLPSPPSPSLPLLPSLSFPPSLSLPPSLSSLPLLPLLPPPPFPHFTGVSGTQGCSWCDRGHRGQGRPRGSWRHWLWWKARPSRRWWSHREPRSPGTSRTSRKRTPCDWVHCQLAFIAVCVCVFRDLKVWLEGLDLLVVLEMLEWRDLWWVFFFLWVNTLCVVVSMHVKVKVLAHGTFTTMCWLRQIMATCTYINIFPPGWYRTNGTWWTQGILRTCWSPWPTCECASCVCVSTPFDAHLVHRATASRDLCSIVLRRMSHTMLSWSRRWVHTVHA